MYLKKKTFDISKYPIMALSILNFCMPNLNMVLKSILVKLYF